jgi:hypothetical protein
MYFSLQGTAFGSELLSNLLSVRLSPTKKAQAARYCPHLSSPLISPELRSFVSTQALMALLWWCHHSIHAHLDMTLPR